MAKEVVSVVVSRMKKKKKMPTKQMSKRRKLRSALKRIFNYMKSDSYMFAPLIRPQSSTPVASGEFPSFKPPMMKKKENKLVEHVNVNEYLKCDAYMYAPLSMDSSAYEYEYEYDGSGTTPPPSGDGCGEKAGENTADVISNPIPVRHSLLQSERVKHILDQNYHSFSSTTTEKVLSQRKPG